jgi:hypothetical protein
MKIIIFFMLYFTFSTLGAETFYKCVAPDGKVSLQGFPCLSDQTSKEIEVYTTPKSNQNHGNLAPPLTHSVNPGLDQAARSFGFSSFSSYQSAKQECMSILSRYDLTAPSKNCSFNDMQCFARSSEAMNRIYQQMTNTPGWKANNCDTVMEIERGANKGSSSTSYTIEFSHNDELFIINGEKFKAKTYCFGMEQGDRVAFIEGSPFGACSSAKIINIRNEKICDVWCE